RLRHGVDTERLKDAFIVRQGDTGRASGGEKVLCGQFRAAAHEATFPEITGKQGILVPPVANGGCTAAPIGQKADRPSSPTCRLETRFSLDHGHGPCSLPA